MFFTLEIQEIRKTNNIYKFQVKRFTTMKEIKTMLQKIFPFPLHCLHLFHTSRSLALNNNMTLHEIGIDRDGFLLILSISVSSNAAQETAHILEPLMKVSSLSRPCQEMLNTVRQGLLVPNQAPGKTDLLDCTGGVYFMKSAQGGSLAAVFKPHDEEQGMPNNPKGYAGNGKVGLRQFFNPGEGYLREAAAYLLDVKNVANVPPTCIVHCEHPSFHYPHYSATATGQKHIYPKLGSLQQYVKAADTFEDISPSLISVYELQKIALFDMRILNCDRNSANILAVRKPIPFTPRVITNAAGTARRDSRSGSMTSNGEDYDPDAEIDMNEFMNRSSMSGSSRSSSKMSDQYELIPIDHGYCLPPKLLIEEFDWVWFYTPHIEQPIDPRLKQYMKEINIDDCIEALRKQVSLPEDSLFLLRLTHHLIVQAMDEGLNLREIAELIARTEDGVPSPLEKAIKSAEENAQRAVAVHGGSSKAGLPISPPRKFVNKSPMTTAAALLGGATKTAPAAKSGRSPVMGTTTRVVGNDPSVSVSNVNNIVNNVLLLPKTTTSSNTMYPLMTAGNYHQSNMSPVPMTMSTNSSAAASPLLSPVSRSSVLPSTVSAPSLLTPPKPVHVTSGGNVEVNGAEEEVGEDMEDNDFLLRDSYLRPKGPIAFLNTLDSKMLPSVSSNFYSTTAGGAASINADVAAGVRLSASEVNRILSSSVLSPKRDGFALNMSPDFESRADSSLTVVREESTSTSHDETDQYDSSHSSNERNSLLSTTFVPVRSPAISMPRSGGFKTNDADKENEDTSEYCHNFEDIADAGEYEGDNSVPVSASNNAGIRRVSSFSLLEVQTTEPMVFEKPSKLTLSRDTSNGGAANGGNARHPQSSGFTSEEESDENALSSELGNISPVSSDYAFDNNQSGPSTFSLASRLAVTHGLTRVVSFNAFESPALYEADRSDRHLHRLKREKRKLSAKSPEFQELRMAFAEKAIIKTIARHHLKATSK